MEKKVWIGLIGCIVYPHGHPLRGAPLSAAESSRPKYDRFEKFFSSSFFEDLKKVMMRQTEIWWNFTTPGKWAWILIKF